MLQWLHTDTKNGPNNIFFLIFEEYELLRSQTTYTEDNVLRCTYLSLITVPEPQTVPLAGSNQSACVTLNYL